MTIFKIKVFAIVRKIPKGKSLTYKQVAILAGGSRAYRAVGNILSSNSDFKNIPCHRVIRSDGKAGGYLFGTEKKYSLLKKEGVF